MQSGISSKIDARAGQARASWLARALLGLSFFVLAGSASAQLSLNITPTFQSGTAGETFTFSGTITNNTGSTLQSTDLFLDFSGFDPSFIATNQVLGTVPGTIADGSTSATLDLFQLTLSSGAVPEVMYGTDVTLQDANFDLSDPVTVTVEVVPEPAISTLLIVALLPVVFGIRRRKSCAA